MNPVKNTTKPPVETKSEQETAGWDPYEVWRTRVLLPRMQAHSPQADASAVTPALVGPIQTV